MGDQIKTGPLSDVDIGKKCEHGVHVMLKDCPQCEGLPAVRHPATESLWTYIAEEEKRLRDIRRHAEEIDRLFIAMEEERE